jgi:hypothetical protein
LANDAVGPRRRPHRAALAPFGSHPHRDFENKTDERGRRLIWLDRAVVDRLRAMRGAGESFSDVILRIAAGERQR